ncbi:MAG: chromosomal replication initiator protein DnaA, partial [Muribaculaceae bacterium]|nr:chromosomal replication initiator protein DnaA [Muribaculaceae bacterium]
MTGDFNTKWLRCLEIISDNLGETKTNTWFLPAKPVKYEGNTLTLSIPSSFFYEKYEDEFYSLLSSTMKKVFGPEVQLDYLVPIISNDEKSKVKLQASKQSHAVK